mmetsp:Transcript_14488/g.23829  ORF Transcript_14488/g.23829 Transcript_14488/m.23829 type:complete len:88 (+) Transcript_14488:69-332(+)
MVNYHPLASQRSHVGTTSARVTKKSVIPAHVSPEGNKEIKYCADRKTLSCLKLSNKGFCWSYSCTHHSSDIISSAIEAVAVSTIGVS